MSTSPNLPVPWILRAVDAPMVESAAHLRQRLDDADPDSFLPQFISRDHDADGTHERSGDLLLDCGDLYKTPGDDWWSITSVVRSTWTARRSDPSMRPRLSATSTRCMRPRTTCTSFTSVRIEQLLYSIARDSVKVQPLQAPATTVAEVSLRADPGADS